MAQLTIVVEGGIFQYIATDSTSKEILDITTTVLDVDDDAEIKVSASEHEMHKLGEVELPVDPGIDALQDYTVTIKYSDAEEGIKDEEVEVEVRAGNEDYAMISAADKFALSTPADHQEVINVVRS